LVKDAIAAIDKVNADTSVGKDDIVASLEELKEHIFVLLDALDE
jgi:hypothetical protein